MPTIDEFNRFGSKHLPGHLGIVITAVDGLEIRAELPVTPALMAPNGFLHAGSVVSLADTAAGYGCVANLPDGAKGFTTLEIKSNHLGTVREGVVSCVARAIHVGKSTQVWDAEVFDNTSGKRIALFRCTQMILY
jgi:1,4-dihydroxy-2-naphthoyl-CoA hydrolase